jgi:hypothetical protein
MRRYRMMSSVLVLTLVSVLAMGLPISGQERTPEATITTEFTYQGRLTDDQGNPISKTCDFRFRLYDDLGAKVGPDQERTGVVVSDGLFTVLLNFGDQFDGRTLLLDMAVRCSGDVGSYVQLSPRQKLTAAPYAAYSLLAGNADRLDGQHASAFALTAHNHWNGNWSGSGTGLTLSTNGQFSYAVNGSNTGGGNAIYGTTNSPAGYSAMQGVNIGGGNGVYGSSSSGAGVLGFSTSGSGVHGTANGSSAAVYGNNNGSGDGLSGSGSSGNGVSGSSSSGNGVSGSSSSGNGVSGSSSSGNGVYGTGVTGGKFIGSSGSQPGLYVSNQGGGDIIQGFGTGSGSFVVQNNGDVYAQGDVYASAYNCFTSFSDGLDDLLSEEDLAPCLTDGYTSDFAEMLPAVRDLEPGDLLVIGPDGTLIRSSQPYQATVVGVYSTRPSYVGNSRYWGQAGYAPLALAGIVPVKVSAENGPIRPGDLLTTSATPGHSMRASPLTLNGVTFYPSGVLVGKALAGLDSGTGVILMLVTLQ